MPGLFAGALLACCILLPRVSRADYVYLSKDEALELALGKGCEFSHQEITLSDELLEKLEEKDLEPDEGRTMHLFTCRRGGSVDGYAFIDSQVGKHLPITYIVGLTREGAVRDVEVMVYREEYGGAVKEKNFMSQFEGKKAGEPLRVGKDIKNISGATISARSISTGVQRALFVWQELIGASS